jgi:hypothetical protein
MRWHVNKESRVMSANRETSCYNYRGKTLKPSPISLLKTIKGATKVTNHTLRDRIPRWWMYVNILMQLTIKKDILYIKLRDGPLPNRSHNKKSANNGRMSNQSKSLIIIMTLLLLKITSNKTSLIALKRTIRATLNLIDPLKSDRTSTWGIGHKIPYASPLKSSNLLSHHVRLFRMKNSITIRSWLRKSSGCESIRRVIVRGRWRRWLRLISYSEEESTGEEGSIGEDGTSSTKEEDHTSEEERSYKEGGAPNKRAPWRL